MNSASPTTDEPPDSKAVLFCFDCGHESSVDGDWTLELEEGCEVYRCPECGTTITVRPEVGGDSDSGSARAITHSGRPCYSIGD